MPLVCRYSRGNSLLRLDSDAIRIGVNAVEEWSRQMENGRIYCLLQLVSNAGPAFKSWSPEKSCNCVVSSTHENSHDEMENVV